MSLVVPFARCVARPDREDGTAYPLGEHLHAVGIAWAAGRPTPCRFVPGERSAHCGQTCTPVCDKYTEAAAQRALLFLGGLLHDAGKARRAWQRYIQSNPARREGISHAPSGAALFFYLSHRFLCLLDKQGQSKMTLAQSRDLVLHRARVALDISDHHSDLSDIDLRPPWERGGFSREHLAEIDLPGLASFVSQSIGCDLSIDLDECVDYLATTADEWSRVSTVLLPQQRRRLDTSSSPYEKAALSCMRLETAHFIAGDRYHAGGLEPVYLTQSLALGALEHLEKMLASRASEALAKGASHDLVRTRQEAQDMSTAQYVEACERSLFSLCLPTGMGKTMAALRVALTACSLGRARRIVYVAPYLSILSQATDEMRKATGLEVLQHHHLSTVQEVDFAEDDDLLLMESWQAPIVTTTFSQLFLALFPKKAQHTMRLRALEGAFIIVDEPQVINRTSWKVFLQMIEALAKRANATILFTTATMPPVQGGLSLSPFNLVDRAFILPPRYKIEYQQGELDTQSIASRAAEDLRAGKNVAVVMSTIRGAATLYEAIEREVDKWSDGKTKSLYFPVRSSKPCSQGSCNR
jgi:CRISPR-associated endonuclease/helicase Cas3